MHESLCASLHKKLSEKDFLPEMQFWLDPVGEAIVDRLVELGHNSGVRIVSVKKSYKQEFWLTIKVQELKTVLKKAYLRKIYLLQASSKHIRQQANPTDCRTKLSFEVASRLSLHCSKWFKKCKNEASFIYSVNWFFS